MICIVDVLNNNCLPTGISEIIYMDFVDNPISADDLLIA
jgi:hypothetical protein